MSYFSQTLKFVGIS